MNYIGIIEEDTNEVALVQLTYDVAPPRTPTRPVVYTPTRQFVEIPPVEPVEAKAA